MVWNLIPVVLFIGIAVAAVSVVVDRRRYVNISPVPSRPESQKKVDPDRLLYHASVGERLDEEIIDDTCAYIDGRYDCSDFRFVSLLRILYQYPDTIPADAYERIKGTMQGFRYWIDDPGEDSMCFWSENHQILFAGAEFLAGGLWPDDTFAGSGLTGKEHRERAKRRILLWLEQRWLYGFSEWYSNTYYVEDLGPLCNLIDFSNDREIVAKSTIILDLLLFDTASQSYRGAFVTNSGRMYERGKMGGEGSSMRNVSEHVWQYDVGSKDRIGMDYGFILSEGYRVPEVIYKIGRDDGTAVIRSTNGLNLSELRDRDLIGLSPRQIMMQWGMEAFTNPEVINNSIDFINRSNLRRNEFLYGFRKINLRLLRSIGLLPVISRLIDPQTNGVAIQRSNSYMYRTLRYTMSTSQGHHPGSYGDQQHIWQATLANDLSIFTTHPACEPDKGSVHGNSPGYWVGSGRLPHSVQHENVNMTLYRLPLRRGLMESTLLHYTHAYFPREKFDEVVVTPHVLYGRLGSVYVAMICNNPVRFINDFDAVQYGRDTFWITEIGTRDTDADFADFQIRIKKESASLSGSFLEYVSGTTTYLLEFGNGLFINGELQEHEYPRCHSPYIRAEREADAMRFEFDGSYLELDFYRMERRYDALKTWNS